MSVTPIPLKVDAATKQIIESSGYPIQETALPLLEYGVELLLNLTYYDVDTTQLDTPIVYHPFSVNDLFAFRGDNDFNTSNLLMFLTQEIAGTPPLWVLATGHEIGDVVRSTAGNWFSCIAAGTTGGSEPTWDTDIGDTTVDNTVTWQRVYDNDGINQPGDWESGGTADKTLGQISVRLITSTTKFAAFILSLDMLSPTSTEALIQGFMLSPGNAYYTTILNSKFQAGGTVDTVLAMPSPANPAYLNSAQSSAMFVDRVLFNLASAINLQISSGAVTRNNAVHTLEPETGTADELDTINGILDGECCVLKVNDSANDIITLKHGTGNILTPDGNDLILEKNGILLIIGTTGGNVEITLPFNPASYAKRDVQNAGSGTTVLTAFNGLKLLLVDTTSGSASITLHAAADWSGELLIIKTSASNTLTVTGTVNGAVNPTITTIRGSYNIFNDGNDNFITPKVMTP